MAETLVIKDLDEEMDPVFSSDQEYERFRDEFSSKMEPILDEQRKARKIFARRLCSSVE